MNVPGGERSRRSVLAGSAAALLACAGCGSTGARSTPSTTPATATGSAGAPAEPLAKTSAIPAGSGLVVVGARGPVLLAHTDAGKVVAHTAVCTHQGATIDGTGICPLHGSKFDVITGAVLAGPATTPLVPLAVTVTSGEVFLE